MIPRPIHIRCVLNGYEVKVGCQTVVFSNLKYMLDELESYFRDPKAVEAAYRENAMHREFLNNCVPSGPEQSDCEPRVREHSYPPEPHTTLGAELAARRSQPRGPERAG